MPLIGNGIKSKTAGKSGLNNRIYQLFYVISKKHVEINTEKVSLSIGPLWETPFSSHTPGCNSLYGRFIHLFPLQKIISFFQNGCRLIHGLLLVIDFLLFPFFINDRFLVIIHPIQNIKKSLINVQRVANVGSSACIFRSI